MTIDEFIDAFVERVNAGPRHLKLEDEIAPSVAERSHTDPGSWVWSVRRYDANWVDELESRLPRRFPLHFRSLVSRYIFPEFSWGKVLFFGNTPESIGYPPHELRIGIFNDRAIFDTLTENGYVQFGQPESGGYDPVCFGPAGRDGDAPIVRVDHEEILIRRRLRITETIAPSFRDLILSAPSN